MTRLLRAREVAELAQVSVKTVHGWRRTGRLEAWVQGRVVRFRREDVEQFLGLGIPEEMGEGVPVAVSAEAWEYLN